jgi:hypothetical protein
MRATDYLKQQHREIEELFRDLERDLGDQDNSPGTRVELAALILAHLDVEDRLFNPAVPKHLRNSGDDLVFVEEHEVVRFMVDRALTCQAGSSLFEARLRVLKDVLFNHIEEEESELLYAFDAEVDREDSDDLCDKMSTEYHKVLPAIQAKCEQMAKPTKRTRRTSAAKKAR